MKMEKLEYITTIKNGDNMKVTMLGKWPKELIGGPAVHKVNLVKSLSKLDGLELHVVSFGDKSKTLKERNTNITLIKARKIYYYIPILALIKLALEVRKVKPDIIHIQGSNLSPYLLYALLFNCKSKKIVTFHSYGAAIERVINKMIKKGSLRYKFLKMVEKRTIEKFNLIISVDTRIKKWIIKEFGGIYASKIKVIMNGVPIEFFVPRYYEKFSGEIKKKHNIPYNAFIIFNAKAMEPKNGQEYLVLAMKKILEKIPEAFLILGGDGPLKDRLIHLTEKTGVNDRVVFVGNIPNSEIPKYLDMSEVIVVPSIHIEELEEASSIFLAEAMAMGKPCIASNIGGLKESIVNGVRGILVPDKNPDSIAMAVLEVYKNPNLGKKLGCNARKYVEKERTWDKIANMTLDIYKNILRETSQP